MYLIITENSEFRPYCMLSIVLHFAVMQLYKTAEICVCTYRNVKVCSACLIDHRDIVYMYCTLLCCLSNVYYLEY